MVATTESPPADIVTISLDPLSGIVSVDVKLSPPLEVVDDIVMLVGGLELEVSEVVDVPVAVLGGRGLDLGVAGGPLGSVVFRVGHPEDPASRRTGQ